MIIEILFITIAFCYWLALKDEWELTPCPICGKRIKPYRNPCPYCGVYLVWGN